MWFMMSMYSYRKYTDMRIDYVRQKSKFKLLSLHKLLRNNE